MRCLSQDSVAGRAACLRTPLLGAQLGTPGALDKQLRSPTPSLGVRPAEAGLRRRRQHGARRAAPAQAGGSAAHRELPRRQVRAQRVAAVGGRALRQVEAGLAVPDAAAAAQPAGAAVEDAKLRAVRQKDGATAIKNIQSPLRALKHVEPAQVVRPVAQRLSACVDRLCARGALLSSTAKRTAAPQRRTASRGRRHLRPRAAAGTRAPAGGAPAVNHGLPPPRAIGTRLPRCRGSWLSPAPAPCSGVAGAAGRPWLATGACRPGPRPRRPRTARIRPPRAEPGAAGPGACPQRPRV